MTPQIRDGKGPAGFGALAARPTARCALRARRETLSIDRARAQLASQGVFSLQGASLIGS